MFKKSLLAAALALPLTAFATVTPVTFNDSSLGGSANVTFNQMQISGGGSIVTLTDANSNGLLDGGDTFVETGLVAGVGFTNASGNPIANTGINSTYQLWAQFSPLVGYVSGASVSPSAQTFIASFVAPSIVSIFYDTNVNDGLTAGSQLIGVASLPTSGSSCAVTNISFPGGNVETGSCILTFAFDAAGVTAPGVWTSFGQDIGSLDGISLRVDMNVDNFTNLDPNGPSFFSPTYTGRTQTRLIDHNGSASFVPEPASLALLGLGLLGMGVSRRRKASV